MKHVHVDFSHLLETVRTLRGADGCPWDKKQTHVSLEKYLREECSELLQAIANEDPENICEELGDLLYLIIMYAEINAETSRFTIGDVINMINDKLVRRHPHVFKNKTVLDDAALHHQWQEIKRQEKGEK